MGNSESKHIQNEYVTNRFKIIEKMRDPLLGLYDILLFPNIPEKVFLRTTVDPSTYKENIDIKAFVNKMLMEHHNVASFHLVNHQSQNNFDIIFEFGAYFAPPLRKEKHFWEMAQQLIVALSFLEDNSMHYPNLSVKYVLNPEGKSYKLINPFCFPAFITDVTQVYMNLMYPVRERNAFCTIQISRNILELGCLLLASIDTNFDETYGRRDYNYALQSIAALSKKFSANVADFLRNFFNPQAPIPNTVVLREILRLRTPSLTKSLYGTLFGQQGGNASRIKNEISKAKNSIESGIGSRLKIFGDDKHKNSFSDLSKLNISTQKDGLDHYRERNQSDSGIYAQNQPPTEGAFVPYSNVQNQYQQPYPGPGQNSNYRNDFQQLNHPAQGQNNYSPNPPNQFEKKVQPNELGMKMNNPPLETQNPTPPYFEQNQPFQGQGSAFNVPYDPSAVYRKELLNPNFVQDNFFSSEGPPLPQPKELSPNKKQKNEAQSDVLYGKAQDNSPAKDTDNVLQSGSAPRPSITSSLEFTSGTRRSSSINSYLQTQNWKHAERDNNEGFFDLSGQGFMQYIPSQGVTTEEAAPALNQLLTSADKRNTNPPKTGPLVSQFSSSDDIVKEESSQPPSSTIPVRNDVAEKEVGPYETNLPTEAPIVKQPSQQEVSVAPIAVPAQTPQPVGFPAEEKRLVRVVMRWDNDTNQHKRFLEYSDGTVVETASNEPQNFFQNPPAVNSLHNQMTGPQLSESSAFVTHSVPPEKASHMVSYDYQNRVKNQGSSIFVPENMFSLLLYPIEFPPALLFQTRSFPQNKYFKHQLSAINNRDKRGPTMYHNVEDIDDGFLAF